MSSFKKCPKCKGTGTILRYIRNGGVWSLTRQIKRCQPCFGTGKVAKEIKK